MTLSLEDISKLYKDLPWAHFCPFHSPPDLRQIGDVVYDAKVFTDKEYWDDVYDQIYDNQTSTSVLKAVFKHSEKAIHSVSVGVSQTIALGAELSIEGSCGGPPPIPGYKMGAKFTANVSKTSSQHEAWSTEKLWEVDQEVDTPPRKTYQALMQIRDKIQDTTWTAKCEVSGKYASVEMMGKEGPILREVGWPEAIREAWKGNRGLDWTGWELTDKQGLTDPVIGLVKGTITAQYGVKVRVTLKDITKADDVHEVATYVVNA